MTVIDINAANAALKRVYGNPKAALQFEVAAPYYKSRTKENVKIGAGLYDGIQTQDNQSLGNRNTGTGIDNEDLPVPTAEAFDQPVFDTVRTYGVIALSGKAVNRAMEGLPLQSFMGDIGARAMSLGRSYAKDADFRLFNTSTLTGSKLGARGVLNNSTYAASTAAQTFTLDTTTDATCRRYKLLQGIAKGMRLQVYSKTTWTYASTLVVTSINENNGTFAGTLSDSLAGTSNEWYLFREGDFNRDVAGLGDIIDDGTYTTTYAGITTGGDWQGVVLANGGTLRDFSAPLMNTVQLRLEKRNDGDEQMEGWMSYGMRGEVLAFYQRMIQVQKEQGTSPFKVNIGSASNDLQWGPNFTLKTSPRMPAHEIFFATQKVVKLLIQQPWGPVNIGGSGNSDKARYFQRVSGKDNWEAAFVEEAQQKTIERNKLVKLADINQAGVY